MIFDFLKKQRQLNKKKDIIELMIISLNIPDEQKKLYLEAISILNIDGLEKLYVSLINFTKEIEFENLNNQNFSYISGMRKKEAQEKQKEINSFSFLLSNI